MDNVIRNNIIPFKGFSAINLFGVIFVRNDANITPTLLNHEAIHTAQMKELGYLLFYVIYLFEWLVRLTMKGDAYMNISFEQEAYKNAGNQDYLLTRPKYAQWKR